MGTKGTASAQRALAAERREKAWELRKRGYSFRAIAEELERDPTVVETYSKSQAERDVKRVLEDLQKRTVESAAEARLIDLARLDDLLAAWFASAVGMTDAEVIERLGGEGGTVDEGSGLAALGRPALDKAAADVVLKVLERRAKMLGLDRQDVALLTPAPLTVAVAAADLSGLGEAELDAVIRNLQAALGAGND